MLAEQIASLNDDQRKVALCETHCLAVAAPGSGKTKTLAVKAAHILASGKTVTAVTFTRDAALELRERIISIAGENVLPNLLVGTFHSIDLLMAFPSSSRTMMGRSILKGGFSKLTRKWEIVKESNRRNFVERSIQKAGGGLDVETATAAIEAIKAGQMTVVPDEMRELVETYGDLLSRYGVIDFQDILLETNKALKSGQISPLHTSHLLIDEFQDTDLPQFDWAMVHASAGATVTAVGDDDQSIYGFRRALGYKGMMRFATELDAERIVLGTNYRSFDEVLKPARTLIGVNSDRMHKQLVAAKGAGGSAYWDRFGSHQDEEDACVKWIAAGMAAGQTVGVLARTNKRLDGIEALCLKEEIPYERADGGGLLQTAEMAVFMAMLGLIVDDDSRDVDLALSWCKVEEDELSALHKVIGGRGIASLTKKELDKVALSAASKSVIAMLAKRRHDWRVLLGTGGLDIVLDRVLEVLMTPVASKKRSVNTLTNIHALFSRPIVGKGCIEGLRERLTSLRGAIDRKKKSKDEGEEVVRKVALMTAHGSKGLEWDRVWLLGAEQGVFPDEGAGLQEERRLFFVAVTRARKNLMVSSSGDRPTSVFVPESEMERAPL